MLRTMTTLALAALLFALSTLPASAGDGEVGKRCTLSSLRGKYGYSYQGTVEGFGSVAAVGPINFDGAGNTSATYSVNLGGTNFQGSFAGAYTVNPQLHWNRPHRSPAARHVLAWSIRHRRRWARSVLHGDRRRSDGDGRRQADRFGGAVSSALL
jgi:hypothetical protein